MIHLSQIVLISYCKNLHGCISVHSVNIPNLNKNVAVCDVKPDHFCCTYLVRDSGTCRQRAKWRQERETSWLLLFLLVFFLLLLLFLMCCSLHKHKETKSKVKLKVGARLYHSHCFVNVGQTFSCFPKHIPPLKLLWKNTVVSLTPVRLPAADSCSSSSTLSDVLQKSGSYS